MTATMHLAATLGGLWRDYRSAVVIGVAVSAALVVALVVAIVGRLRRSPAKSTVLARYAAVATMVWTSEGLYHVTVDKMHTPRPVAVFAFCVFELGALAAAMFAEEQRATKGVPGTVGKYVFVIAMSSGTVSALGETATAGIFFRLILPPLFVGLWWILLNAERPTDTPEMKTERQHAADEQEATWVYTPRSVLVRLGLMKPGRTSTTTAQRDHQVTRMVVAADLIASGGRRAGRARKRLRRLARTADADMVTAVAQRVRRAVEAEALMVPDPAGQAARTGGQVARSDPNQPDRAPGPDVMSGWTDRADRNTDDGPLVPAAGAADRSGTDPDRSAADPVTSTDAAGRFDADANGQRTDAQVIGEHGADLFAVMHAGERLTRYRVEQICDVSARQAARVRTAIEDLFASWRTDRTEHDQ